MKRPFRWLDWHGPLWRPGSCRLAVQSRAGPAGSVPDPRSRPEIERKSFIVADGFEVNLFAADPLDRQADPDELRPRRPALDRQLRGLSPDQAGRRSPTTRC